MDMRDLSLRDLTYLAAVAEQQSFSRAAAACHISQVALNMKVKKIERTLGVEIFERRPRRQVLLTTVGEVVIEQVGRILEETDRLGHLAAASKRPLVGAFRLGAITTLGPYLFPHLLPKIEEQYPHLRLLITERESSSLLAALRSGELDAVLLATPYDENWKGIKTANLFHEPLVLITPHGHPLASKQPLLTSCLVKKEMVLLSTGHCLRAQALDLCPDRGGGGVRHQATNLETLRHLVASGTGYSLIPKLAVPTSAENHLKVRYRRFLDDPARMIILAWQRRFPRTEDISALTEVIRQAVPEDLEDNATSHTETNAIRLL